MSKLTIDGFLFCVIACAACNSDSSTSTTSGTTTDPFLGKWACSEEMSVMFTSPPGVNPIMETEMTTIVITGSSGALTARKENDSGSNCSVAFTSTGSSASLADGQTCMTNKGLVITYKSGSATVNGSSMNSTFSFDASGTINAGGMMVAATATGTQTSTCARVSAPTTGGGVTTGGW